MHGAPLIGADGFAPVSLSTKATPAWIHPNADESGYYRWSVPADVFARFQLAWSAGSLRTRRPVRLCPLSSRYLPSARPLLEHL